MATIQLSTAVRNARLDVIESTISTTPILWLISGTLVSNCATADGGTVLASISLPSDWMNPASAGSKTLLNTWAGSASAAGTVGHFRITAAGVSSANMLSGSTFVAMQGDVTITGGGGALTLDNPVLANAQAISITSFTLTDANA